MYAIQRNDGKFLKKGPYNSWTFSKTNKNGVLTVDLYPDLFKAGDALTAYKKSLHAIVKNAEDQLLTAQKRFSDIETNIKELKEKIKSASKAPLNPVSLDKKIMKQLTDELAKSNPDLKLVATLSKKMQKMADQVNSGFANLKAMNYQRDMKNDLTALRYSRNALRVRINTSGKRLKKLKTAASEVTLDIVYFDMKSMSQTDNT